MRHKGLFCAISLASEGCGGPANEDFTIHWTVALIASRQVLADTLQTDRGISDERETPELAAMPAEIVSSEHRNGALCGGDSVDASSGGMSAIKISGFNFRIANTLFAGEPVLSCEKRRVGVGERATG